MIFQQFYLACLAQASYLVADERTKTAVVVDPRRDVDLYLDFAAEHGLTIRHVLLTHFHADFLAGHLELQRRTGASIHIGAKGRTEFERVAMEDGGELELGDVVLRFLSTPGHTPESMSILVFESADASAPHAVLTGDALFVGDVGRPDLMASVGVTADELANCLYDSLHEKLLKLPDETLVYPAHGAGSLCGKALGSENHSTIGAQRATNWALQPMERAEFVAMLTADQPQAPSYFAYDADLNRKERPLLDDALEAGPKPLALDEVVRLGNSGAQILDCRNPFDFAAGHLDGAINIGLDGKFATWAGFVLDRDRSIVIVAEPGEERQALVRLGRIGYEVFVVGFLEGGMAATQGRDDLVASFERVDVAEFDRLRAAPDAPVVLDVRGPGEWKERAVEGVVNLPLQELKDRLDEVPRDRPLVLYCKGAYRSAIAASLLQRAGISDVRDLIGGFDAWAEAHPVAAVN